MKDLAENLNEFNKKYNYLTTLKTFGLMNDKKNQIKQSDDNYILKKPFLKNIEKEQIKIYQEFYNFEQNNFKKDKSWKKSFEEKFIQLISNILKEFENNKNKIPKNWINLVQEFRKIQINEKTLNWEHLINIRLEHFQKYKNHFENSNISAKILEELILIYNKVFQKNPNQISLNVLDVQEKQLITINDKDIEKIILMHTYNNPDYYYQTEFMIDLQKISEKFVKILKKNAFSLKPLENKNFLKIKFLGDKIGNYTKKFFEKIGYILLRSEQTEQIKNLFESHSSDNTGKDHLYEWERLLRNVIIEVYESPKKNFDPQLEIEDLLIGKFEKDVIFESILEMKLCQVIPIYFELEEKIYDDSVKESIHSDFTDKFKNGTKNKEYLEKFKEKFLKNNRNTRKKVVQILKIFVSRYIYTGNLEDKAFKNSIGKIFREQNINFFNYANYENISKEEKDRINQINKILRKIKIDCSHIKEFIKHIEMLINNSEDD